MAGIKSGEVRKAKSVKALQANDRSTDVQRELNENEQSKVKKSKEKKIKIPPSFSDVSEYCLERKNGIDPQKFIDFYETNGWMRGKTKIKSWKACIRTWEGNNTKQNNNDSWKTAL